MQRNIQVQTPRILYNLKKGISAEATESDAGMLEWVRANFQESLSKCINENGQHMMDVVSTHEFENC